MPRLDGQSVVFQESINGESGAEIIAACWRFNLGRVRSKLLGQFRATQEAPLHVETVTRMAPARTERGASRVVLATRLLTAHGIHPRLRDANRQGGGCADTIALLRAELPT